MIPPEDVPPLIRALPSGSHIGIAHGRRYLATRQDFARGQAIKVVARALDGSDYISANLYDLAAGPRLYPCEMPAEKVIAFLRAFQPGAG